MRWIVRTDTGAETGSNAGSPWELGARADNGSGIDNPIVIVRAAGGLMSLSRPVTISGLLTTSAGITTPGNVISTVDGGTILGRTGASTNHQFIRIANTTGDIYFGVESSVAGAFFTGSSA